MCSSNCVTSSPFIIRLLQTQSSAPSIFKFGLVGAYSRTKRLSCCINVGGNSSIQPDEQHHYYSELQFKEREPNFLEFDDKKLNNEEDSAKIRTRGDAGGGIELNLEELEKKDAGRQRRGLRRGSHLIKRSNLVAKQVISIQSALSYGFVSQIWVDTTSWLVSIIEVRPSLLSGDLERFLLEDVSQVGDVVLIQDESAMKNEFIMIGMETLVGYDVVTPGGRIIGKVRGYTFDISSGAIGSLELDSFGISIIPSSVVSTYALFVEDVLEVVADTVLVHEAAASHIQRVTKGFWDAQKVDDSMDMNELGEYPGLGRQPHQSEYVKGRRKRPPRQKSGPKVREDTDDWELPMDYL